MMPKSSGQHRRGVRTTTAPTARALMCGDEYSEWRDLCVPVLAEYIWGLASPFLGIFTDNLCIYHYTTTF
jgi:hypothetical protein